jgi:hypothetical protein
MAVSTVRAVCNGSSLPALAVSRFPVLNPEPSVFAGFRRAVHQLAYGWLPARWYRARHTAYQIRPCFDSVHYVFTGETMHTT